jgi:hypothetical protein
VGYPSDSLGAASVNLGFTPDISRMFNGSPMVTHELAQFVEVLDRGAPFSRFCLATEMLRFV